MQFNSPQIKDFLNDAKQSIKFHKAMYKETNTMPNFRLQVQNDYQPQNIGTKRL